MYADLKLLDEESVESLNQINYIKQTKSKIFIIIL